MRAGESCTRPSLAFHDPPFPLVVPKRTIHAGPSPKYYHFKRGITWLNAVNDQVAGIGQMVVPGPRATPCTSWTPG
jgi:hypothetical protein